MPYPRRWLLILMLLVPLMLGAALVLPGRSAVARASEGLVAAIPANAGAALSQVAALTGGLAPAPAYNPVLDPNRTPYPSSSLHDFSDLQDAPAGKNGFMTVRGDHFYWNNGKRARFWGINVANTSLQESDADIDAMMHNFRTAGFNLIRLHQFDERDGIIDLNANDSRHFDAARWKKLDYWIYKARENGIYVYMDLLDYRHFKTGDGVANPEGIGRSAKPYAVFDRRLIELQKEYALNLLRRHINPYTGVCYADDPTVAMVELYDENGLFMRRGLWREMVPPYQAEFQGLWNAWLKQRYGNTPTLQAAWTDGQGHCALMPGENLERGTVQLPAMTWTPESLAASERPFAALPRRNDGALFGYEIHRHYLREMKEFLHNEVGVKVPVCVTGRYDDLADLRATSEEMDFIGCNFYYDHPYWAANKPAWQLPSYYHNTNPLHDIDDHSLAAATSLARIKGKPFVVREWNYCWPNQNRSAGMVEAAVYGALHDFDAMILFAYETKPTARVSYFNVRSDPARWGLVGVGAAVFLQGLVQPSMHKIVVPYNPVDTFTYTRYHQPLYSLGWATRVENDFFDGSLYLARPGTDLMVIPGRSSIGQYSNAPAVLHTEDMRCDLAGHSLASPEYLAPYGMTPRATAMLPLLYDGLIFDQSAQENRALPGALSLNAVLAAGYRPIGSNQANDVANGFLDMAEKRMVFGSLEGTPDREKKANNDEDDVLRAALDAMQLFHDVPNNHDETAHHAFHSDTGEIFRDAASGRLVVNTPLFQSLCGDLTGVGGIAGGLGVRNGAMGTIVALSLDGRPLVTSRRYVIKMVTGARNVDESETRERYAAAYPSQWRLDAYGLGPVTTDGRAQAQPVQISLCGKPMVDVYLTGGSFELYMDNGVQRFYCDTPGARFTLHQDQTPGILPVARWQPTPPGQDLSIARRAVTAQMPLAISSQSRSGDAALTMSYPRAAAEVTVVN